MLLKAQAQGVLQRVSQKSGSPTALSQGWHNELLNSELLLRYLNLAAAGLIFSSTYPTATPGNSSATATSPFCLFNPPNSGKNLVILEIALFFSGLSFALPGSVGAGVQAVSNQTPTATTGGNTPLSTLVGSSYGSVAKTFVAGTLVGAPIKLTWEIAAINFNLMASDVGAGVKDSIDGMIIVAPGSMINIVAMQSFSNINTTPTITWAEIPI